MDSFPIIRVVTKLIIPYILLFGLYVQFHGDFGPGGGFQAGVIIASAFILYGLVFGLPAVKEVAPPKVVERLIALGVLVYAGTGLATTLLGRTAGGHAGHDDHGHSEHAHADVEHAHAVGEHAHAVGAHAESVSNAPANFLDYEALNHDVLHGFLPHGQHLGIFLIELGVGITVTAVMIMIFYCFASRSDLFVQDQEDESPDANHQGAAKEATA